MVKKFYHYEHRTTSLREFFIRVVLRRPVHVRRANFMLSGLDMRVEPGESVALIGRNGSGKSTALRLIAGIYDPTSGTVETRGRITAVIELGVGFNPELTGSENVGLYASVMGLTSRETETRLPGIMEFADIGEFIHEPVKYYSSGMRARLAFAIAVAVTPDILLLDEVLAVGDQNFRARCMDRLRDYRERGGTLVVVSHDFESVRDLCSRAIWLSEGRVLRDGPVDEVIAAYESAEQALAP